LCQGTTYVYDSFFKPYVAKHEPEIDRSLSELRTRAGDYVVLYSQRAVSYGQTRIYDILKFVSAQSTPAPQPAQVHYDYALVLFAITFEFDLTLDISTYGCEYQNTVKATYNLIHTC